MATMEAAAGWVATAADRSWLVRFCARLAGDPLAAEDLAQETLLEAWRRRAACADGRLDRPWLAAIARNVALRWRRRRGRLSREQGRLPWEAADGVRAEPADVCDLELALERSDLARLLDRAMALLPPATRQVLVERYIQETPEAEIALRLGVTSGAVAVRLHRGRLAMRQLLATELRDEAEAYGLAGDAPTWRETSLWCPCCGAKRLLGRFGDAHRWLQLRCPACCAAPGAFIADAGIGDLLQGVQGFRPAYARLLAWCDAHLRLAADGSPPPCPRCGQPMRPEVRHYPPDARSWWAAANLRLRCDRCVWHWDFALCGGLLSLPAVRRFWRDHPRMRFLPPRPVEAAGRPALVATFAAVGASATLPLLVDRASLAVLGAPAG